MLASLALQVGKALLYYAALVLVMRLAGKRHAGQTTTFDLVILITLGVVLQSAALAPGPANAVAFVLTVFAAHRLLALGCARFPWLRVLVRGKPRALVRDGRIDEAALRAEGMTLDELEAGLRKLGHAGAGVVRLAVLEETGQISALPLDAPGPGLDR